MLSSLCYHWPFLKIEVPTVMSIPLTVRKQPRNAGWEPQSRSCRRVSGSACWSDPRKPPSIPWRRSWQPTPVFSPGISHGRKSLVGHGPRGRKRVRHGLATKQRQTACKLVMCFYHGLPWWLSGKDSVCQCRRCGLTSWVRKIPWRRKWQPIPIFLPRKFHG